MATVSRGIKAPIIREGDDIVKIVTDCVLSAAREDGFEFHDRDVVAVTEAVVARAAGNYATVDNIGEDVKAKLQKDIYKTAVCLPKDLGMEKELALVTRAARDIYELYFPGEGGMPE